MLVKWNVKKGVKVIPIPSPIILDEKGIRRSYIEKQIVLVPGWNDIPNEDWLPAMGNVKEEKDSNLIIERWITKKGKDGGKDETVPATIREINTKEAEEIFKETFSSLTLEKWKNEIEEGSKRLACSIRLEAINKEK